METNIATLEQMFERYGPCVLVDFTDEDGEQHTEKIQSTVLMILLHKGIKRKSEFLLNLQLEQDFLQDMIQQLKSDETLRSAQQMKKPEKRFL